MKKITIAQICVSTVTFICCNAQASDLALNELSHLSELQYGYDNYASVELNNAYNGRVDIIQDDYNQGYGNSAKVLQKGENNDAYIAQYGSGNIAYINQYGNRNTAHITEYGSGNAGLIKQYGNDNEAAILQKGDGNQGQITQYNDDNKALIVQKSNVQYFKTDITQNGGQTHVIINGMNKGITIR
ncbi:hypothetical protein [Photobacterium marinum]|uniref:hypothetical protein n=1 Tax=Photobacterium marinum TaxID=1056511 RepID=UPI000688253D|nr:hypothetical protein [Photobacterium marinum]